MSRRGGYPSKAEHEKVVPTWNYVMVQARGKPRLVDDEGWLRDQIAHLTHTQEHHRPAPWKMTDAPEDFITGLLTGIIGLEIPVERIEGKWKVSQNRSAADRQGVVYGLRQEDSASPMANLVAAHRKDRP